MKWTLCFEQCMRWALGIMASCRHGLTSYWLIRQDDIYLWRRYQWSRENDDILRQDPIMRLLDVGIDSRSLPTSVDMVILVHRSNQRLSHNLYLRWGLGRANPTHCSLVWGFAYVILVTFSHGKPDKFLGYKMSVLHFTLEVQFFPAMKQEKGETETTLLLARTCMLFHVLLAYGFPYFWNKGVRLNWTCSPRHLLSTK